MICVTDCFGELKHIESMCFCTLIGRPVISQMCKKFIKLYKCGQKLEEEPEYCRNRKFDVLGCSHPCSKQKYMIWPTQNWCGLKCTQEGEHYKSSLHW